MGVDGRTIEDWYKRYGPLVLRRCRRLLGSDELAREAMQDVFVSVWRRAVDLHADQPAGLLYRAATSISLNLIRSRRVRPAAAVDGDLIASLAMAPDGASAFEARHTLVRLFHRQQESTRLIATLHLLDGMTLEEVAAEVGLSVSGVRKRLTTFKSYVKGLEHL